jgi:hypothetical protein
MRPQGVNLVSSGKASLPIGLSLERQLYLSRIVFVVILAVLIRATTALDADAPLPGDPLKPPSSLMSTLNVQRLRVYAGPAEGFGP